ncbi:MAG TPA: hypothetical protein VM537_32560, partial [Anaerolineae bacterium]|nr:hypothetical protein [Anaerolineae bacterium]
LSGQMAGQLRVEHAAWDDENLVGLQKEHLARGGDSSFSSDTQSYLDTDGRVLVQRASDGSVGGVRHARTGTQHVLRRPFSGKLKKPLAGLGKV